jgi:hypothetical protein
MMSAGCDAGFEDIAEVRMSKSRLYSRSSLLVTRGSGCKVIVYIVYASVTIRAGDAVT